MSAKMTARVYLSTFPETGLELRARPRGGISRAARHRAADPKNLRLACKPLAPEPPAAREA
jgi:hypothetical protein